MTDVVKHGNKEVKVHTKEVKGDIKPGRIVVKHPKAVKYAVQHSAGASKLSAERDKAAVLQKIQEILAAHGGAESNIGHNTEYWGLLNQYRGMP